MTQPANAPSPDAPTNPNNKEQKFKKKHTTTYQTKATNKKLRQSHKKSKSSNAVFSR
jgi:hypothetical protein